MRRSEKTASSNENRWIGRRVQSSSPCLKEHTKEGRPTAPVASQQQQTEATQSLLRSSGNSSGFGELQSSTLPEDQASKVDAVNGLLQWAATDQQWAKAKQIANAFAKSCGLIEKSEDPDS